MWRRSWLAAGVGTVLLSACGDRAGPVLAAVPLAHPERSVAPDGHEVPSYESEAAVPPEYAWAEVRSHRERIGWESNAVTGYGSMEYFGNRGRITLEIQVLHGYSTVASTRTEREQPDFFPAHRMLGIPLFYTVPEACGQMANLSAQYSARTILFIETRLTEVGPHVVGGAASASQPACPDDPDPCVGDGEYMTSVSLDASPGANASPDEYLYDPYDPAYAPEPSSDCPGTGRTGGGERSTQTFPEMCSGMGGTLYYDYGCIERYNRETGGWETIWCGTYAVCET